MPAYPKHLLSIQNLSVQQAIDVIQLGLKLKLKALEVPIHSSKVAALVFFEPSTRTRMSFEIAAHRLGVKPVLFTADSSTSVAKGESLHETLENILAMQPDLAVVRHNGDAAVTKILNSTKTPIVNAGDGTNEHPTQALLDAMTVFERRGQVEGERIVFVGDVEHSRVARSGRALFTMLGAEVAVCAPDYLQPKSKDWADTRRFTTLSEAVSWATVCMGLRVQKERHHGQNRFDSAEYIKNFRIDRNNIGIKLASDGLIMHPGPFVADEDLSEEILQDSRCAIHDQTTNGVYLRMAVLGQIFGVLK